MYEEVKEAIEGNGVSQHLDYDTIKDLEYLEGEKLSIFDLIVRKMNVATPLQV